MDESHVKIEQINSVTITPKKVYSYEYMEEKKEDVLKQKRFIIPDKMGTRITQYEQYKLTQIEPKEPINANINMGAVYYGNGSGVNGFNIDVKTFENSKKFLDVLCGGYKNDGKVIYTLPHATFELINEKQLPSNYIKYFETIEDARKFVGDILEKSESKFTII